ncbi:MAG TPA: metalloregulator ArsR/SmtB family transcription factor [Rectinemataceae bacterium]|nr:metalloregulator ArsR/SmtB family transcription factor [Rectinemataceae bacterium]
MNNEVTPACRDELLEPYATKFKAIGHPVRLKILCLIARQDVPCVGDLWHCLNQPQPVVSQHLAILKKTGIVSSEVQKTKRVYSIVDPFIKELVTSIVCEIQSEEKRQAEEEKQTPLSPV